MNQLKDLHWPAVAFLAVCLASFVGFTHVLLSHIPIETILSLDPEAVLYFVGGLSSIIGLAYAKSISKRRNDRQTIQVASGGNVTVEPAPVEVPEVPEVPALDDAERTPTEPIATHTVISPMPRPRRITRGREGSVVLQSLVEMAIGAVLALVGAALFHGCGQ